jgi:hypothetical protein
VAARELALGTRRCTACGTWLGEPIPVRAALKHYDRFLQQLPELYEGWGQAGIQSKTDRFRRLLGQVQGMTSANVLQLLNWAVACLEPGKVYCEVGSCHGATLLGALLGHPQAAPWPPIASPSPIRAGRTPRGCGTTWNRCACTRSNSLACASR